MDSVYFSQLKLFLRFSQKSQCCCPFSYTYGLAIFQIGVSILDFYLPPAAKGCGWEIIKHLLCFHASIHSSYFYINLSISFIYKDIFTKFVGKVYGYKKHVCAKFWPHFDKQSGSHSQLFKNHKGDLNLEMLQLDSSNFHKIYMAGKASLMVI